MTYLLKVENVVKNYNEKSVLDKVCFSMKEGEIIGLAGPNGAGKTTLLDIVSGFEYADDGKIFFEGVQINEFSEKETADLGIKRTFQEKRPFTGMSVKDNLTVGGQSSESEMLHWSLTHRYQFTQEILQTVNKLLTKFNLQKVSNEYAGNLSGGQKRIVELGKSAASDPNLILLDEPFTGVDPEITKQMIEHIRDLKNLVFPS